MYKLKLFFLASAILLLISSILTGCNLIPEEYTKGVRLDSSYPYDDMPIYDDAVVFYCDADDESVKVKYGTKDDLDDVADFYKDHFKDNEIELDDETDKSSRYSAEGTYKDFEFEIRASEPSDGHEAQLFSTVVRIEIEFIDETVTTSSTQIDLSKELIGFWRLESIDGDTSLSDSNSLGVAVMLNEDGTAEFYSNFIYESSATWEVVDENTIVLTYQDGTKSQITVVLSKK